MRRIERTSYVIESFFWFSFFLLSGLNASLAVLFIMTWRYFTTIWIGALQGPHWVSNLCLFSKNRFFTISHLILVCLYAFMNFHCNFCYLYQIIQELKWGFVLLHTYVCWEWEGLTKLSLLFFLGRKLVLCGFSWAWLFETVEVQGSGSMCDGLQNSILLCTLTR